MGPKAADILAAAGIAAAVAGTAGVGGLFTSSSVGTWYASLDKPAITPPGWVFGPVWTVLYILMGVAAWLVFRRRAASPVGWPLAVFGAHLLLNAGWSALFFGAQRIDLALIEIVFLWTGILATLLLFWRVRLLAGLLMAPYLAWVSFASVLNFLLWRLNG